VFHVRSTNGDSYLGGEDFDNRIVDWLVEKFKKEHGVDLFKDKLALQRIKEAAERSKRELSFTLESDINLPFISSTGVGSNHINEKLTRRGLEELTADLVKKTIPLIEQALGDARLEPDAVQEILLVGGQTRMPLIRKTIADFFRRQPREDINPDEIVAMGAAVQSAILKGQQTELVLLLDVTPFSLGIETEDDTFQKLSKETPPSPRKRPCRSRPSRTTRSG
jgi:molecular chaperone DnaK